MSGRPAVRALRSSDGGRSPRLALPALLFASAFPSLATAQVRHAEIPSHGELWVEVAPTFENWSQQYAEASPVPGVADGEREPLYADYDGPIAERLFPGIDPLLFAVNEDAAALGFDPLGPGEVSLGALDFRTINVDVRRLPVAVELGLFDRFAIGATVPFVLTEVEAFFRFDSAGATLAAASSIPDAMTFLAGLGAARTELQGRIDGGGLTPEQEAAARALFESSGAFHSALAERIGGSGLVPIQGSGAGQQVAARYASLRSGFQTFGITAPELTLPAVVTSADLGAYFAGAPLSGVRPGSVDRGLRLGDIELGLRLELLDGFSEADEPDDAAAGSGDADDARAAADPARTDAESAGGIRFRTTIGAVVRLPTAEPDRAPNLAPNVFLQQPVADAQRDVELALYQDIGLGSRLLLIASARFGIQRPDRITRRVHPPDRPFALAGTLAEVERDLGDYFDLRIAPRFYLEEAVAIGAEYGYHNEGADAFTLISGGGAAGLTSADALEVETGGTRHRLGIGAWYSPAKAPGRTGFPIELGFVYQTAIGGSGGQMPASQLVTARARMPFDLF